MQRMATWRPMPPWCWPRTRAKSRANSPKRSPKNCAPSPTVEKVDVAGPGFINLTLKTHVWAEELRVALERWRRLRPQRHRQAREGQRRIRLRQSDRADACRPRPRRGVRRRAREPAGICRLRRDARILHQRRRRPGRSARALGLSCVTTRRSARKWPFPKASIRATISSTSARELAAEYGDAAQRQDGIRMAAGRARQGHRHDDGRHPRRSCRAQCRVSTCIFPSAR